MSSETEQLVVNWLPVDFEKGLTLVELDRLALALTLRAENDDEPGDDSFLDEELALATLLAEATAGRSDRALSIFDEAVRLGGRRDVERAFDDIDSYLSSTWDDVNKPASLLIRSLIRNGASAIEGPATQPAPRLSVPVFGPLDTLGLAVREVGASPSMAGTTLVLSAGPERVYAGMVAAAKYTTNKYFNQQVMPVLLQKVSDLFAGMDTTPDWQSVREAMEQRLRTVPYWLVVANAAASRAYHYGMLAAGDLLGYRSYQFVAVVDSRTSKICLLMNGKSWLIQEALPRIQAAAESDDIEVVKTLLPWVRYDDAKNLGPDELRRLGVMVPPLHGRCRSTLRLSRT